MRAIGGLGGAHRGQRSLNHPEEPRREGVASTCSLGTILSSSHMLLTSAHLRSLKVGNPKSLQAQKCPTSVHGLPGHPAPPLEGSRARLAKAANLRLLISRSEELSSLEIIQQGVDVARKRNRDPAVKGL